MMRTHGEQWFSFSGCSGISFPHQAKFSLSSVTITTSMFFVGQHKHIYNDYQFFITNFHVSNFYWLFFLIVSSIDVL